MEEVVDAFLYFGPPSLALREQVPADIALDSVYTSELKHRANLLAADSMLPSDAQMVSSAEQPFFGLSEAPGRCFPQITGERLPGGEKKARV